MQRYGHVGDRIRQPALMENHKKDFITGTIAGRFQFFTH
jgi:hypothetical protein